MKCNAREKERVDERQIYQKDDEDREPVGNKEIEGEEMCERETNSSGETRKKERELYLTVNVRNSPLGEKGNRRKVTREEIPRDKKNGETYLQRKKNALRQEEERLTMAKILRERYICGLISLLDLSELFNGRS